MGLPKDVERGLSQFDAHQRSRLETSAYQAVLAGLNVRDRANMETLLGRISRIKGAGEVSAIELLARIAIEANKRHPRR